MLINNKREILEKIQEHFAPWASLKPTMLDEKRLIKLVIGQQVREGIGK